jgi:uncharacterized membrane protein
MIMSILLVMIMIILLLNMYWHMKQIKKARNEQTSTDIESETEPEN